MRLVLATLGLLAIGLGTVLLASVAPTGAVIGGGEPAIILGVLLVLCGVAGIASGLEHQVQESYATELNKAAEYLRERRVVRDHLKLRRLAMQCGYDVITGKREGYRVIDLAGRWVTDIPGHRGDLPTGTARSILEALATGQATGRFRR